MFANQQDNLTPKKSLKGNVRVYGDRQQANLSFHSQKPLSALETTEGVLEYCTMRMAAIEGK
jgi:hypothetical protein